MEAEMKAINDQEVAEVIYEILLQMNRGKDLTLIEEDIRQDEDFKKVMKEVEESLVQFKGKWPKSRANLKKMCEDLEVFLNESKYFKIAGASTLVAGAAATIGLAFFTWGASLVAGLIGAAIGSGLQIGRNFHNGIKTKDSLNKLIKELKPLDIAAKSVETYLVQLIFEHVPTFTEASDIIDGITEELIEKRDQQFFNEIEKMGGDLKARFKFIVKIASNKHGEAGKDLIQKVSPELEKLLSGKAAQTALKALSGAAGSKALICGASLAFDIHTIMSTLEELQNEIKHEPVTTIRDEIKKIDKQFEENSTQIVIDFINDALVDLKNTLEKTESPEKINSSESD